MKVRHIKTGEVFGVYGEKHIDTYDIFSFLIYKEGKWQWEPARDFVPVADSVSTSVKHGKWVKDESRDMLRCSVCKNFCVENWYYWLRYCPECGARMDGE